MNFEFYLPTEVIFGPGSLKRLGEIARRFGTKGLIITGKSSTKQNRALSRAIEYMKKSSIEEIIVFDEVEPNPSTKIVAKASELAIREKVDFIVGLGGGSSLDSAKAVSIVSANEGSAWDYVNYPEGPRLIPYIARPTILVPTTAGTGSEVNRYSVISNPARKEKLTIANSLLYPKASIIDPELTLSMDENLTATTGVDAFTHALEALTNKVEDFFASEIAIMAIRYINSWLKVAIEEPQNIKARTYMSYASMLAGIAIDRKRVALIHGLEHPVSAHYPQIAHADGLAALGPAITRFNYGSNQDAYALFAKLMGQEEKAHKAVDAHEKFLESVNKRISLKGLGVEKQSLERLAEDANYLAQRLIQINPRFATLEDIMSLYELAYEGG
ncbi:MAG: iron-containing alcohol dehydrogenase [Aquificaceae bacterium]|nr:iron-containing alcohol dehydrogenase [Aquificaceae bacterium]MDW8237738.1 iron-containing alcohol dehydrogenase [Aquificaceae bacterium]